MPTRFMDNLIVTDYLIYIAVMAATPGLNTILSAANASAVGLKKGIVMNFGMLTGIIFVTTLALFASSFVYSLIPNIATILKAVTALYLLYLAVRLFLSSMKSEEARGHSFTEGMLLQVVNVKLYILCFTAIATYVIPSSNSKTEALLLSSIIPAVCFFFHIVWALFGTILSRAFKEHGKIMNSVFSLLLIYCAIRLFI